MSKRWDAVTVGEIYLDHVFSGLENWPKPGEEIFTKTYLHELGGGAAITACGLARLGRRTAVFGVIGIEDSDWVERRLGKFGVSAEGLHKVDAATGATVSISVASERSFFSYAGANEKLTSYLLSATMVETLQQASHVHFAVPLDRKAASSLLPALKQADCTVSIDAGWQSEWYRHPDNLQTCREADYFLPNETEAQFLTGKKTTEEILSALDALGLPNTIVKLGANGAAARHHGHILWVPSPPVAIVDTTGAGDAFDAGLIDAILDQVDPREKLRRATVCGSLSVRAAGGLRGLATRQELDSFYE